MGEVRQTLMITLITGMNSEKCGKPQNLDRWAEKTTAALMIYTSGLVLSTEANMLTDKTTKNIDRRAEKDGGERRIR